MNTRYWIAARSGGIIRPILGVVVEMNHIQLQESDVVAALRLHMRPGRIGLLFYLIFLVLVVLAVGREVWCYLGDECGRDHLLPEMTAAITAILVVWVITLYYLSWAARRMYRQQKLLRDPTELEWDEHDVTCRSAAAHCTIAWEDFVKWKENKRLFLIYHADRLFQVVPKRAFASPTEEQDFQNYLPRVGANLRSR